MRRGAQISSSSELSDLPLLMDPPEEAESSPPESLLDPPLALPAEAEQIELSAVEVPTEEASPRSSTTRPRLVAGLLDLGAVAALAAVPIASAPLLGVPLRLVDAGAFLFVGLELSFLYSVFSTAFWGATPGMSAQRLRVIDRDDEPVTLGQAIRRWLGGLLTFALFGLPALPSLFGRRTLADVVSGSRLES